MYLWLPLAHGVTGLSCLTLCQVLLAPLSIFLEGRRPSTAVKFQLGNKQSVVDCGDSLQDSLVPLREEHFCE